MPAPLQKEGEHRATGHGLLDGIVEHVLSVRPDRTGGIRPDAQIAHGLHAEGFAEAVETDGYTRLQGTATVRIAELSRPRVGVAIAVPGHDIGAPEWVDMPLSEGRFGAGTPGGGDWLAGNFHGPGHEEEWGVFDTTDYLGAFGARRQR